MTPAHTTTLLIATFLAAFAQAALDGPRRLLGVQMDFVTPLVVYAALRGSLVSTTLVAVCGALWLDALSENPLGVSVLPLFVPAFVMQTQRSVILRDQRFAQAVLGAGASAVFVILSLVLLLTMGRAPAVGWGTLWVLAVAAASGALLVPGYGVFFSWLEGLFFHRPRQRPSFDPLRQIKRDRHLS
jgi:cell shape-determining protein MreD